MKPGWEPIILARKPFRGSLEDNYIKYGTGALNIDACRISTDEQLQGSTRRSDIRGGNFGSGQGSPDPGDLPEYEQSDLGRWPANVILDEDAAVLLDAQSGELVSGPESDSGHRRNADSEASRNAYGGFQGQTVTGVLYGDRGGASRFYYVAKPSREERDLGCDLLPERQRDEARKAGNPCGDNPRNRGLQPRGNFHPTVKPLALMRWLVRLVTPKDGRVLDPFGGSGTTGMACAAEGFAFTLIEKEAEYIPIIEARVRSIAPLFGDGQ